jgi:hypothetical protein
MVEEHPKCVNLFFCSDGSLARFLDIREQNATNFIFAKLGCSQWLFALTHHASVTKIIEIGIKSKMV